MPSLIKSTAILAFARVTNFSLLLLSPVLLVRFLDTHTFGQYREFVVYAMLVSMLAAFSVKTNLLYFIPKTPDRSRSYVSNTVWIVLFTSSVACFVLFLFRDLILANTSFNFLIPLALYVLFFTNLDILESYWLALKQPKNVLYYSVTRTAVRISAIVGTAFYLPTVDALLTALIAVEALRVIAVLVIMKCLGISPGLIDRTVIRNQLAFVVPLGLAGSLHYLNQYVGQVAVSAHLGVVALAVYTIGNYQIPVLSIIRGSINDSIFPDMVRQAAAAGPDSLSLWKRSNVAYTCLIVPIFVLLIWYADLLIPLVFTEQYAAAVPLFRILLFVMIVQCFEFSSPLRAVNRNKLLMTSNLILLGVNLSIILFVFAVFDHHEIYGPAIAIVVAYVIQLTFLGASIMKVYQVPVSQLMKWRSLGIVAASAFASALLLFFGELIPLPDYVRLPLFSVIFSLSYFGLLWWARIEELVILAQSVSRRFKPK